MAQNSFRKALRTTKIKIKTMTSPDQLKYRGAQSQREDAQ